MQENEDRFCLPMEGKPLARAAEAVLQAFANLDKGIKGYGIYACTSDDLPDEGSFLGDTFLERFKTAGPLYGIYACASDNLPNLGSFLGDAFRERCIRPFKPEMVVARAFYDDKCGYFCREKQRTLDTLMEGIGMERSY